MCLLEKNIESENCGPIVGYKAAVKRDDRYYSLSTNVEYKVGKVPDFPEDSMPATIFMKPVRISEAWYNPAMRGSTACFTTQAAARDLATTVKAHQTKAAKLGLNAAIRRGFGIDKYNISAHDPEIVVLEIRLSDLTYEGMYVDDSVVLGKAILELKELESITIK